MPPTNESRAAGPAFANNLDNNFSKPNISEYHRHIQPTIASTPEPSAHGITGEVVDGDAVAFGELYARSNSSFVDAVQLRLQCGQGLAEKRAKMAHGEWVPWLNVNKNKTEQ
jgi:hypothetical protein